MSVYNDTLNERFTLIESKPEIENLEKGQEDSEYWLSKIEKFTKKIYDEEVENFKKQVSKRQHFTNLS